MALLSQTMRAAAFTGSTDSLFTVIAGRQGRQWAEKTVRPAYPQTRSPQPRTQAATIRSLESLRDQGVLTDSEFEQLRARLEV